MDGRSQVLGGNAQRAERCVPPKVSIAHRGRDDCGKRFGRPDWAIIATVPGAVTVSLLTVGDSVNYKADGVTPYRMVGIPDGLGAFDNQDGTFTVLMNQELSGNGVVRDHGLRDAFVSKWIVDREPFMLHHITYREFLRERRAGTDRD